MRTSTQKFFDKAISSETQSGFGEYGTTRSYANKASTFNEYESTYEYGVTSSTKPQGRVFDDVESDLTRDWSASRGKLNRSGDRARSASRDAWDQLNKRK